MPSNPDFRGAGNNKNYRNVNEMVPNSVKNLNI